MPKLKPTCPRKTNNSWSSWSQSGGWKGRRTMEEKIYEKMSFESGVEVRRSNGWWQWQLIVYANIAWVTFDIKETTWVPYRHGSRRCFLRRRTCTGRSLWLVHRAILAGTADSRKDDCNCRYWSPGSIHQSYRSVDHWCAAVSYQQNVYSHFCKWTVRKLPENFLSQS